MKAGRRVLNKSQDMSKTNGNAARVQPKQSRSQETFDSILEAAAAVFALRGYEQSTTHQVAAEAGVSVGALYRYFDSKQAILLELYSRELSMLRQKALDEFTLADLVSKDLRQLLKKTLSMVFRIHGERPGLRRVLAEQSRKIPELSRLRASMDAEIHGAVRQILAAVPGVNLQDLEVSAYLVTVFISSLLDDFLLYRRDGDTAFSDERVIDAASQFVVRCVTGKDS